MHEDNVRVEAAPEPAPVAKVEAAPEPWSDPHPDRPLPFWSSLRQDVRNTAPSDDPPRSTASWIWRTVKLLVTTEGLKVVFWYRLCHSLYGLGIVGVVPAKLICWFMHHYYLTAISPRSRLHGGLILPHPRGLQIGPDVVVGPQTWIFHNVTIGPASGKAQPPQIGARCGIFAGAVVSGAITIGDDVTISPNSFVQRNVPSRSLAVGVPANVFPKGLTAKR